MRLNAESFERLGIHGRRYNLSFFVKERERTSELPLPPHGLKALVCNGYQATEGDRIGRVRHLKITCPRSFSCRGKCCILLPFKLISLSALRSASGWSYAVDSPTS